MDNSLIIKKSNIAGAGMGVFTEKPIKKGERICIMSGDIIDLNEMIRRVEDDEEEGSDPLGIDDELYVNMDEIPRAINHSCNPNAFLRGKNELVAIRDIKKGEEIFYDYSTTMNDNKKKIGEEELWTMKCKCKSMNCRGIVDQFKTLPLDRKRYYIKNRLAPDFILERFS